MKEKQSIGQSSFNSNEDVVIVGSAGKDIPVSFQTLQDIYNELTGKTEEVENNYKIKYKIKLDDIEQLCIKIQQAFEQYNVTSINCSVTIFLSRELKRCLVRLNDSNFLILQQEMKLKEYLLILIL